MAQHEAVAVVLAAGEGTRMKSAHPKVVHQVLGKPLVQWVVDASREAGCSQVVTVIGNGADEVAALLDAQAALRGVTPPTCVIQHERKGTGHAVQCARAQIEAADAGSVVVLSGDSPLITSQTIKALVERRETTDAAVCILTFKPENPQGYGRIVRGAQGTVTGIVEQKDCTPEQAALTECNSGVYCFETGALLAHIDRLSTDNAQGEYYLTDMVALLHEAGAGIEGYVAEDPAEATGVNSRLQLAQATKLMQRRINEAHLAAGVTMLDPDLVWIGPEVTIGRDTEILPLTILTGATRVGEGCTLGPNTRLTNVVVGNDCVIDETVAIDTVIDNHVSCGPRAYLRPGTHMCDNSKAGTHVEIKKSIIGAGSKVPHLSYVGDTTMGEGVNIGAGTITCNYDGVNKNPTRIGDGAFIGSDTMLVAPVIIGEHAVTGAGSTITKEVPAYGLGLERSEQRVIENYGKRQRGTKKGE